MSVPRGARTVVLAAALVVAAAVAAVVVRTMSGGEPDPGPVDAKLAAEIRSTGVTPYVVDLDGATITKVRVRGDYQELLQVDYRRDDGFSFTLTQTTSEPGDLCGPEGSGEGEDGGSCTSEGDRSSSEFEERGSFTLRRSDTTLTLDTVIESDPDLPDRADEALDGAQRVSVDDLARY